jgi:hypothetical protein
MRFLHLQPDPFRFPLWLMCANTLRPRLRIASWRRFSVSSTENGLRFVMIPSIEGGITNGVESLLLIMNLLFTHPNFKSKK